jgi:hypothetical protein
MIIRGENRASRAAANAETSGMKDALQSQTVYLCNMSDASLFLIRYEKLDFASADPASAGVAGYVPVACPTGESRTVSDGYLQTTSDVT